MQIAEDIIKHGMPATEDFKKAITALIKTSGLKKIIETGSYKGLGTTRAIADALTGDEIVYSIEVNPEYHAFAKFNNRETNIRFMLGLSVPKSMRPTDITFDVPDHVIVDHRPEHRFANYMKEVMFDTPDDRLKDALEAMDYKPDLVILDSAGHMGWIEFIHLSKYIPDDHSYYLALDDTNHVKHYNTLEFIKNNPKKYSIIYQTDEGFGSAIIKVH